MGENAFMDNKEEYLETVMEACRTDPTAYDRLILGIWTRKPTGRGLFAHYFRRELHVRGSVEKQQYIIPSGNVIDVGYDIGTANTGISFEERLQTKLGEVLSIFDEIVLVEEYIPLEQVAPKLLARMNYWCGRTGRPLFFNHIGDSASFDQMRPDGSYDARKLEQEAAKELRAHPERYPHLTHIIYENPTAPESERQFRARPVRLRPCEKPEGSVMARVKIFISKLQAGLIVISARCLKHIEMFEHIPQDSERPYHPVKNSRHKHAFDSSSYPAYHFEMGGRGGAVQVASEARLTELRP
jgi:hypothetical protein